MTLTQGHGCGIDWYKFACLHDKVRTTHPITTRLGSYIPHAYHLNRFWRNSVENSFFDNFVFKNFGCVFTRSNTLLNISQEWLVWLTWSKKEVHLLDTGWTMWPLPMTLTLDFSRSNFEIAVSQELLVSLMWNEKESNQILGELYDPALWPHPWPWPWPWSFKVKYWNSLIVGMRGLIDMERKGCE